jgi:hypothetical protein
MREARLTTLRRSGVDVDGSPQPPTLSSAGGEREPGGCEAGEGHYLNRTPVTRTSPSGIACRPSSLFVYAHSQCRWNR